MKYFFLSARHHRGAKGYTVLHPKARAIQGDGIDFESAHEILTALERRGWSIDNLAFGEGRGALQMVNRDTLKMATKCSAVKINGQWSDVYKDPATDPGKTSKRGLLVLVHNNGQFPMDCRIERGGRENDLFRVKDVELRHSNNLQDPGGYLSPCKHTKH